MRLDGNQAGQPGDDLSLPGPDLQRRREHVVWDLRASEHGELVKQPIHRRRRWLRCGSRRHPDPQHERLCDEDQQHPPP